MHEVKKKPVFTYKKQITWNSNVHTIISCFALLICILICTQPVFGAGTNETIDAAGRVTVTDVVIEPSVLMTGDVGLITFIVENTGLTNVAITDAQLISKEIVVLNSDVYKTSRTIGAGTRTKFTFTILANQPENIYYPAFYINYRDAGSLRYNVPIRVEEPNLAISVSGIPQVFSKGVTTQLSLLLGNAKSVNITGITIVPSGDEIQIDKTSAFIGDLPPHSEKAVLFEITPLKESDLTFNISYTCGMNAHDTSYSIVIPLGTDKLAADPLINNIEISSGSGGNIIAGDVSNAGLSDAYGVIVALESSSDDSGDPNQKYVIGTITSGDFASFEITVPQNLKSVPLVILFKDSSGNQYSKNISIDTNQVNGGFGSSLNQAPGGFSGDGNPPMGTASRQSGGFSSSRGTNPMNPLSGMGSGMNSLPVMEILYGIGILLAIVIIWKIWKKKIRGRKIRISFK